MSVISRKRSFAIFDLNPNQNELIGVCNKFYFIPTQCVRSEKSRKKFLYIEERYDEQTTRNHSSGCIDDGKLCNAGCGREPREPVQPMRDETCQPV